MKETITETVTITKGRFNNLIDAHETLMMIAELDPVKNSAEDYRDAICAILEMKGWSLCQR